MLQLEIGGDLLKHYRQLIIIARWLDSVDSAHWFEGRVVDQEVYLPSNLVTDEFDKGWGCCGRAYCPVPSFDSEGPALILS